MSGPLVSIVTPSYNQAEFVETTIRSVLAQSYTRIEYIVCDGGSQDGTVDIIKRYSDRLAWWCSEKDRGQSDAINKGWRRATGDILAYLNSDDILLPGAVEHAVRAFRQNPSVGLVYGDWVYLDEDGAELGRGRGGSTDLKRLLRDGQIRYIAQPASLYRADVVRRVGLIDDRLHYSMDYDLLLRLSMASQTMYLPVTLAGFRLHMNAKSSAFVEAHWRETLAVRARYGGRYLSKQRLLYWRYRAFAVVPRPMQMWLRRIRNSRNDWTILKAGAADRAGD
jgi:glycosyltransferase involved in cell wall biosynthesis